MVKHHDRHTPSHGTRFSAKAGFVGLSAREKREARTHLDAAHLACAAAVGRKNILRLAGARKKHLSACGARQKPRFAKCKNGSIPGELETLQGEFVAHGGEFTLHAGVHKYSAAPAFQ